MVQLASGSGLDERVQRLQELQREADPAVLTAFRDMFDASWVYHDSALDGVVYNLNELQAAMTDQPVTDTALVPIYDEIRQHKAAIAVIRELAEKKGALGLDVIRRIYLTLAPDDEEGKAGLKYRKEMPLHRLYFHDISTPDKIAYKMRQLIDWMNSAETRRSTHSVRLAAKAHHQMLLIYPFKKHTGKVSRLLMNLILMRSGYPPAIIHATERQRYYEAIKTSPDAVAQLVTESLSSSIESAIRYLEVGGQMSA